MRTRLGFIDLYQIKTKSFKVGVITLDNRVALF